VEGKSADLTPGGEDKKGKDGSRGNEGVVIVERGKRKEVTKRGGIFAGRRNNEKGAKKKRGFIKGRGPKRGRRRVEGGVLLSTGDPGRQSEEKKEERGNQPSIKGRQKLLDQTNVHTDKGAGGKANKGEGQRMSLAPKGE